MADAEKDLWPSDLGLGKTVTPVSILRTQATLLSQKTQGILEGAVETGTAGLDIYHRFVIVVPLLGNYRYPLFKVRRTGELYPVYVDEEPRPVDRRTGLRDPGPVDALLLADERQFREWLRSMLSSDATKQIIANLYAQASTAA